MVDVRDMLRQVDDLHRRVEIERDPRIRSRLNRMADAYLHIAETEVSTQPASVHGIMAVLSSKRKPEGDGRAHNPPPPKTGSMKQTNEPWKQPVEKEQAPGRVSSDDLERWQKTKTH